MTASAAPPAPAVAQRLRWATLVVVVGWAVTVLPPVYAPRVLIGAAITVVGLVLVPLSSLPASVVPLARTWFLANVAALAIPVVGLFLSWPNATLLLGGAVALVATLHLAPIAGRRLAPELDDDEQQHSWATDLRLALAGDVALAVTAAAWALTAAAGAAVLAGLAVVAAGTAVGLYAWAGIRIGVDATRVGDWLRAG